MLQSLSSLILSWFKEKMVNANLEQLQFQAQLVIPMRTSRKTRRKKNPPDIP